MPATITASGTWSALDNANPTSQAPGANVNEVLRQHYDTAEQRFQPRSLNYKDNFRSDVDGMQEVMQFVGLFADGYDIAAGVAIARIVDILKGFRQTQGPSEGPTYIP